VVAEDVNGDGRADLLGLVDVAPAQFGVLVGHSAAASSSFLFIVAGSQDGLQGRELVRIPEQGELASLGDTNGDGYGDVVAVRETSLIIYLGGPDGLSADRVRRIEPPAETWFRPKTITGRADRD